MRYQRPSASFVLINFLTGPSRYDTRTTTDNFVMQSLDGDGNKDFSDLSSVQIPDDDIRMESKFPFISPRCPLYPNPKG